MPSMKQKFAGFLRQMSNASAESGQSHPANGPSRSVSLDGNASGCFIQRYLSGESRMKQPDILFGRTGQELPCLRLCPLEPDVIATHTGPDGGLTTVNRGDRKRHVDFQDPDVQFIDSEDESAQQNNVPPTKPAGQVIIRAMGQTFVVQNEPQPRPPTPAAGCDDEDEDPPTPTRSSSSSSSPADRTDDYRDIFSEFGGLPGADPSGATTLITSPDDTLVFSPVGSASSPLEEEEATPSVLPLSAAEEIGADHHEEEEATENEVAVSQAEEEEEEEDVAGIVGWNRPGGMAFGAATSLYERHPVSGETAGNPVADAFAVVARGNNALLCLADGVNWGERAALAARSAVHGAMDYLNRALFPATPSGRHLTTSDVFLTLLRSFHAAHSMILQEGGLLTTLTAAVVAQMDQNSSQNALYSGPRGNSAKFVCCVCNVGDSLAYVYSPKHGVREITHGSHDVNSMRDMRDALGALGPVDGQNPELNNLTCSMTILEEGDIVFLTSDGVSDNFDPVVGKFVVARKPDKIIPLGGAAANGAGGTGKSSGGSNKNPSHQTRNLPSVEAFQRHELTLLRMEDILRNGTTSSSAMPDARNGNGLKAQQLCEDLIDFATRLTTAKRRLLEDLELYVDTEGKALDAEEQKIRRRKICERLSLIPGKLDHATCVAYEARIQQPTNTTTGSTTFRESAI